MATTNKAFLEAPKGQADERQAVALEFIAHYLDRIDEHLERIANAVEKGDASETMNIERAIASAKTTL